MKDTDLDMRKKQHEIFMRKPASERIQEAFKMTEFARMVVQNRIKRLTPDISSSELKAELFKTVYRNDFSSSTLEIITRHFLSPDLIE